MVRYNFEELFRCISKKNTDPATDIFFEYAVSQQLKPALILLAYPAYRPKASDTDANRNPISNIHASGVSTELAAKRILNLAASMMKTHASGCQLREELPVVIRQD